MPASRIFLLLLLFASSCQTARKAVTGPAANAGAPAADREFRAAWVATVANINWPSKPGLPVAQQQAEAIALLDFLKDHHFNAVVFQVRPQADALYQSALEPWSYYLTGTQGKAPDPFYDPLTFWIEAAHDRGLELHAWLNPYRSHHVSGGPLTDSSIVRRKPNLSVYLKEGYWWFDPSLKETQDHSAAVVRDLVSRYDLDGIHFDDYFYPYPSYNKGEDFPDSSSWAAYKAGGGTMSRGDWRRASVNTFIRRVYEETKQLKPTVKFGLSPFGIWRPGYPASISGFDQYDVLYADAKLWLNEGWVDYFSPQLYWPIARMGQSFPVLLGWWAGENKKGRHLWPGISVGRDTASRSVMETLNQVMITRGMVPESKGVVHWSISSVTGNPALQKALDETLYKREALVPASPWLDDKAPGAPAAHSVSTRDSVSVKWVPAAGEESFRYIIYYRHGSTWSYRLANRGDRSMTLPRRAGSQATLSQIAISAIDRSGNESLRTSVLVNE
ncbi:MAG: hypothetical protein JWP27_753 [Flaviaesturariibacter sp.]|nr:hypothetical protein [Flaviaesturariibacter sp.]